MRAKDIIHLIDSNIEEIRTSENKSDKIISLLETNKPTFNLNRALYEGGGAFYDAISAFTDITPYIISGVKGLGVEVKYVPLNSLSVSDAKEVNIVLEYIYKLLNE